MSESGGWAHRGPEGGDADQPAPDWSTDDLRIDALLQELLRRLLVENDGTALSEVLETAGPRLHDLAEIASRSVGLCAEAELAIEWVAELAVSLSTDVPRHPLAEALDAMTARARAIVTTLSAQPLPDEDGYSDTLPRQWMERLGLEPVDQRAMYIHMVVLHRQSLEVRWVMRDVAIRELDPSSCAADRRLAEEQVHQLLRQGRMALLEAAERFEPGDRHG